MGLRDCMVTQVIKVRLDPQALAAAAGAKVDVARRVILAKTALMVRLVPW